MRLSGGDGLGKLGNGSDADNRDAALRSVVTCERLCSVRWMEVNPMMGWGSIWMPLLLFGAFIWYRHAYADRDRLASHHVVFSMVAGLAAMALALTFLALIGIGYATALGGAVDAVYAAVHVFPLVGAIVAWLLTPALLARRLECHTPEESGDEFVELAAHVGRLAPRIGLRRTLPVLIGERGGGGAHVLGHSPGHSRLVLDRALPSAIAKASEGDAGIESALREFILLHELAHVLHADTLLITWAEIMLRVVPWAFGALVCVGASSLLLGLDGTGIVGGFMMWGPTVLTAVLLRLVVGSTRRRREALADARAALVLAASEVALLTGDSGHSPAPMATLLRLLGGEADARGIGFWPHANMRRSLQRFAMRHAYTPAVGPIARRFYDYLFATHDHAGSRARRLSQSAVSGGAEAGFDLETWVFVGATWTAFVLLSAVTSRAAVRADLPVLDRLPGDSREAILALGLVGVVAMTGAMARSLLQPAAAGDSAGPDYWVRIRRRLSWAFLSSTSAALVLTVSSPILAVEMLTGALVVLFMWLFVIPIGLALHGGRPSFAEGPEAIERGRAWVRRSQRLILAIAAVPMGALLWWARGLLPQLTTGGSDVAWVPALAALCLSVLLWLLLHTSCVHTTPSGTHWGFSAVSLVRWRWRPNRAATSREFLLGELAAFVLITGMAWYPLNFATAAVFRLVAEAGNWSYGDTLPALVTYVPVLTLSVWVMGAAERRRQRSLTLGTLMRMAAGLRLAAKAPHMEHTAHCREQSGRPVLQLWSPDEGGFRGQIHQPWTDVEVTWWATNVLHLSSLQPPAPERTRSFLLGCAAPTGGFGPWPGAEPTPMLTWCALSALRLLDHDLRELRHPHAAWLSRELVRWLAARSDFSLQNVFWATAALALLGERPEAPLRALEETIESALARDRDDPRTLRMAVETMAAVGGDWAELREKILREHFLPLRPAMRNLRPQTHLIVLEHFVGLGEVLGGDACLEAEEIAGRLADAVAQQVAAEVARLEEMGAGVARPRSAGRRLEGP